MSQIIGGTAFGSPGAQPRWTEGDKDAAGTAYNAGSRVWFTLRDGILNEAYYPTVDRPQLRGRSSGKRGRGKRLLPHRR